MLTFAISTLIMITVVGTLTWWVKRADRQRQERRADVGNHR